VMDKGTIVQSGSADEIRDFFNKPTPF